MHIQEFFFKAGGSTYSSVFSIKYLYKTLSELFKVVKLATPSLFVAYSILVTKNGKSLSEFIFPVHCNQC